MMPLDVLSMMSIILPLPIRPALRQKQ